MSAKKSSQLVVRDVLLEKAMELEAREVQTLRFDPKAALLSCNKGVDSLDENEAQLREHYPGFDIESFRMLPALCERADAARIEVERVERIRLVKTDQLYAQTREWRQKLLPLAESLANAGRVDADEVVRIREGRGAHDNVRDVQALVPLLSAHEQDVSSLFGRGALEKARAKADEAMWAWQSQRRDGKGVRAAVDLRDRYATLIVKTHARLRLAIAAVTSWETATKLVPSLHSHGRGPRIADATVAAPSSPQPDSA